MHGKKKVLVAGGAGFIGSHLCSRLLYLGAEVICVDNFHTGYRKNVRDLLMNPSFELIRHDVVDPLRLKVDEIYNLASPASPPHYQQDPIHTIRTNVIGSLNLLELAKEKGAKIFQFSTSEVYGDPLEHPQRELYWGNVNPIGVRANYDESKRCAETLFFDFHRKYGVEIKVARLFNTYGPRMHPQDGRVVTNFIIQALTGAPLTIYGDGSQTRSFCYVDDLVDACLLFMDTPFEVTGPMNLGNPAEITIKDFAELIVKLTGSKSEIVYCALPSDDPTRRRPDISQANHVLGWSPKTGLEEGLWRTIHYFRSGTESEFLLCSKEP